MNNILWKANELDPSALYCHGRFLMALRNFVESFFKPIVLAIRCLENSLWFRK